LASTANDDDDVPDWLFSLVRLCFAPRVDDVFGLFAAGSVRTRLLLAELLHLTLASFSTWRVRSLSRNEQLSVDRLEFAVVDRVDECGNGSRSAAVTITLTGLLSSGGGDSSVCVAGLASRSLTV